MNEKLTEEARHILPHEERAKMRVLSPYFPFLTHVLSVIDRKHHGGSLLVVPSEVVTSLTDDIVRIKYRMAGLGIWDLCRGWMERILSQNTLSETCGTLDEHYQSIMQFAEFVGELSGVDGAVVVSDKLEIVGFGAEITANAEKITEVYYHPDARSAARIQRIDGDGTRHRSVIRFCKAVPGSVGFILSQDGGMKAVTKGETKIEMWGDVIPSY